MIQADRQTGDRNKRLIKRRKENKMKVDKTNDVKIKENKRIKQMKGNEMVMLVV